MVDFLPEFFVKRFIFSLSITKKIYTEAFLIFAVVPIFVCFCFVVDIFYFDLCIIDLLNDLIKK